MIRKTLIISGCPNSGKNYIIFALRDYLIQCKGFQIQTTFTDSSFEISMLLRSADGKTVLVHSATDDEECVHILRKALEDSQVSVGDIGLLITSCRAPGDGLRRKTVSALGLSMSLNEADIFDSSEKNTVLEFPLVRMRPSFFCAGGDNWKQNNIIKVLKALLDFII